MPYDPVREAALASPVDGPAQLPRLPSNPSPLNGGGASGGTSSLVGPSSRPYPHPDPIDPQGAQRRSSSLAHILSPVDDDSVRYPPRNIDRHQQHQQHQHLYRGPVDIQPIHLSRSTSDDLHAGPSSPSTERPLTLQPTDHRHPSYSHYRDYPEPRQRSPESSRYSLSPSETRSNSPARTHSPEDFLQYKHRPRPSLSPVSIREAEEILYSYPHRPSRSPISHRGTPLSRSPVQTLRTIDDRAPTSQQPVIAPLLPSPPLKPASPPPLMPISTAIQEVHKPAPLPYAPRNRITPADSVLVPLSPSELETYRHSRNPLRSKISSPDSMPITLPPSDAKRTAKRRRDMTEDENAATKRSRDAAVVVDHYNSRPNTNIQQRQESPIIGMKSFNNWIKSVLIAKWAVPVLGGDPEASTDPGSTARRNINNRPRGKVLDMGCGKGGDLQKWRKSRAETYYGLDVAETSITQARERAVSLHSVGVFTANFFTLDCYSRPISDVLEPDVLEKPFDVVTMQFCMHYAFETISKARMMLENVARYLRVGGRFVGTIPNGALLLDRLAEIPPDATELSFGNSVYKVTFENRQTALFGQRYKYYLLDAVEDVPEYVVHWDNLVQLAQEHGLHLIERKEFHDIFTEEQNHRDYGPLLKKMNVVNEHGDSQMDEDQWEAVNVYIGFVFEKR